MQRATARTLFIMLGIMALEGVPLAIILTASRPGILWRLYGLTPNLWPATLAAVLVATAYTAYAAKALPIIRQRFFDRHWLKLLAIPFALITGTMEEVWFRHGLMDWAAAHAAAPIAQIAISATAFGLIHAVWGIFARQWRVALGSMIATGILGAALALVYLLADRQVAPCILAHTLINLAIEPWLLLGAVSAGKVTIQAPRPSIQTPR